MTRIAADTAARRCAIAAPGMVDAAQARAAALEAQYSDASAQDILRAVFSDRVAGPAALVSSFGAESAALLHLVSLAAPDAPVLLLDTLLLFPETLAYQETLSGLLGLTGVRRILPGDAALKMHDPLDDLRDHAPDACCDLRKVRPLARALAPYETVVSGRKRFQAATRAHLPRFEADADGRMRVNPLANWSAEDVRAHIKAHDLPRHPLVAGGFASIGCAPCTTPVAEGEDPRAGRWRGRRKVECGIHFVAGRVARPSRAA
jgi:phosphoadenosine phosphosulfate reductase